DAGGVGGVARRVVRVRVARLAQPLPVVARSPVTELRIALPDDLQLRGGLDCVVLPRRDDGEEVGDLHDLSARDVLDRAWIDAQREVVLGRVRTGSTRTNAPGMQHPRHADVVDV